MKALVLDNGQIAVKEAPDNHWIGQRVVDELSLIGSEH